MINTKLYVEKYLQNKRFKMAIPYLKGDVLDFGGNNGELSEFVNGKYYCVNYDHSILDKIKVDTIAILAVLEHLTVTETVNVFKKFKNILKPNGQIIITSTDRSAISSINLYSKLGIIDRDNVKEHKHFWNKKEFYDLAENTGFKVIKYMKFELIFNQFILMEHK